MYIVNVAIRWANGDLEGFGSSGLSEGGARDRALAKAHDKARSMPSGGSFTVLSAEDYAALSVDEQDELQSDWSQEAL